MNDIASLLIHFMRSGQSEIPCRYLSVLLKPVSHLCNVCGCSVVLVYMYRKCASCRIHIHNYVIDAYVMVKLSLWSKIKVFLSRNFSEYWELDQVIRILVICQVSLSVGSRLWTVVMIPTVPYRYMTTVPYRYIWIKLRRY